MSQAQDPERILVTGASGAVGPRVVQALYDEGYQIRTLSLNDYTPEIFPGEVEIITGDITNIESIRAAIDGCDCVVHLAALLHIVNPPDSLRPKYQQVNVGGTINLIEASIQANVRRFVYFSTINVYGPTAGQIISEDFTPNPDTFYAGTKLSAEKFVLDARARDGTPFGVVFRLGAVYGSRIKGNYNRLLKSLARKRFVLIGTGSNRRTLVYDKDVARAAVAALHHPAAPGNIFNVTDGHFHTVKEIISEMCAALGRNSPHLSLPIGPVRQIAGVSEDVLQFFNRKVPITRASIEKYTEDIAVDGRRIQEQLGFSPQYDLAAGWNETVAEMRRYGDL